MTSLWRSPQVVALFGSLLCLSTAASSNRFADNADMIIPRALNPQFSPLGIVQRVSELAEDAKRPKGSPPTAGRATAFYIGPCAVVTNYHVAYGFSTDQYPTINYGLVMHVGFKDESSFLYKTELTPTDHGEYTEEGQNDWAVLRDRQCLGKKVGWFNVARFSNSGIVTNSEKFQVILISYPADTNFASLSISVGRVTGYNAVAGNILYNVSEAPGSSGGAVGVYKDGKLQIVGINVGGPKEGEEYQFDTYRTAIANEFKNILEIPERSNLARESMASTIANPADQFSAMKPRLR